MALNISNMISDSGGSSGPSRHATSRRTSMNDVFALANSFGNSATSALRLGQQQASASELFNNPFIEGGRSVSDIASEGKQVISDFLSNSKEKLNDLFSGSAGETNLGARSGSASSAGSPISSSPVSPIYIDAPLAEKYGMDAYIAYQEALSNTSHQREINDLKKAGLNPVLSASYGGSSTFSPTSMGIADSSSSGSGSSGSVSSAKNINLKSLKIGLKSVGTLVGYALGKPGAGTAVGTLVGEALDLLTN